MNSGLHTSTEQIAAGADISTLAQQYVLNLFNQKNDPRLVYHTYRQTVEIAKAVSVIAEANKFTEPEWQTSELSAWFVNSGFLLDYKNPILKTTELVEKFLAAHRFPKESKTTITDTLTSAITEQNPKTIEAQLLSDAINSVQFGPDFFDTSPLLRLEQELLLNQQYSKEDWEQFQMQQLLNARFFTSHGKMAFEPLVSKHLISLKERLERRKNKNGNRDESTVKNLKFTHRKTNSGVQTFIRTTYRNHINLSAIADNKAHIMISVNAILISVIISVISYRNMTETNPAVLMPTVIFLMTGLTSLIFAVLAARPKVTSVIHPSTPLDEAKQNLVFFGNFVQLKQEKFEALMEEMFMDNELLYGNMTRDLYNLGKVLDKKYRRLSISYNIFMVGFVATVLTFLAVLLG